jgi:hypothetical protein
MVSKDGSEDLRADSIRINILNNLQQLNISYISIVVTGNFAGNSLAWSSGQDFNPKSKKISTKPSYLKLVSKPVEDK